MALKFVGVKVILEVYPDDVPLTKDGDPLKRVAKPEFKHSLQYYECNHDVEAEARALFTNIRGYMMVKLKNHVKEEKAKKGRRA